MLYTDVFMWHKKKKEKRERISRVQGPGPSMIRLMMVLSLKVERRGGAQQADTELVLLLTLSARLAS